MKNLLVISLCGEPYTGSPFLISEGYSLTRCKELINHQISGGFKRTDYAIVERISRTKTKDISSGEEYELVNSVYTPKAWQEFLDNWRD